MKTVDLNPSEWEGGAKDPKEEELLRRRGTMLPPPPMHPAAEFLARSAVIFVLLYFLFVWALCGEIH